MASKSDLILVQVTSAASFPLCLLVHVCLCLSFLNNTCLSELKFYFYFLSVFLKKNILHCLLLLSLLVFFSRLKKNVIFSSIQKKFKLLKVV